MSNPSLSERFAQCFTIAELWRVKNRAALGDCIIALKSEILQALDANERLRQACETTLEYLADEGFAKEHVIVMQLRTALTKGNVAAIKPK